jgi:Fe-S cluster assembly iron-binding protein IscA
MLVLTDAAAEVVKSLTSTTQAPDEAGLRIASSAPDPANPGALQVSATQGPSENDQVIESGGAHVYLEPHVAVYLDDKILDAQLDSTGGAHFTLGLQHPDQV